MCTEWAGLKAKLIWGSFSDRCDDTLDPTVARHIFKYLRIVYCGNVPVLQQLNAARLTAESVCMCICMSYSYIQNNRAKFSAVNN